MTLLLNAAPISAERVELGESCRWDGARQRLLWVDVFTGRLFCATFDGERLDTTAVHQVPGHLTAVSPCEDPDDGWIVAANQGFGRLTSDGELVVLAEPEATGDGATRMNDGACDPRGRFWAGSMAYDASPGAGSLYRYDGGAHWTRALGAVTISNGIGWSADGSLMYYVDSGPGTISVLDYDVAHGTFANRRILVQLDPEEGVPDGLCLDDADHLWVAIWGGGEVRRYSPDGQHVASVQLDASQPSSCALGGADGRSLFITTARAEAPPETLSRQPDAGRVFHCRVPVGGPPARAYRPG